MKSEVFRKAWKFYHEDRQTGMQSPFGDCLRRAWKEVKIAYENAKKINEAIEEAGITEEVKTWYQWKEAGREVVHGQKAVFQVTLQKVSNGKPYVASYFTYCQTQEATEIAA